MGGINDSNPGAAENGLQLSNKKTATGASGAATCNGFAGVVTTEALSDAAAAEGTYTITNNKVKSDSIVLVNVANGTNTRRVTVADVTPANGSFVVAYSNLEASNALNGTLKFMFVIV